MLEEIQQFTKFLTQREQNTEPEHLSQETTLYAIQACPEQLHYDYGIPRQISTEPEHLPNGTKTCHQNMFLIKIPSPAEKKHNSSKLQ